MAWIEVHQALRDHRKVLALAERLGMPEPHVVGHLTYLWLWALDNAPDGVLPNSERIIERAAGWEGERGAFVAALIESGFVDTAFVDALIIHDWDEYAGRLIEKRKANADRMRVARSRTPESGPTARKEDVQRTCNARAGATVPYPTVQNTTAAPPPTPPPAGNGRAANAPAAAAAAEDLHRPTNGYAELIRPEFPKIAGAFGELHDSLTATWLRGALSEAEQTANGLDVHAVLRGLERGYLSTKERFRIHDPPVTSPKALAKRIVVDALVEAAADGG